MKLTFYLLNPLMFPNSSIQLKKLNFFHTTTTLKGFSRARESRFLNKLVTGSTKQSKKIWFENSNSNSKTLKELSFLMTNGNKMGGKGSEKTGRAVRRLSVLNTVFMEHITSLLATGEVSTDIIGQGIEITQIKMSPDFSHVNIYWYSSSTESTDEKLEEILTRTSKQLRHIISQLRVIGQVPPIKFIKDLKFTKFVEVEKMLSTLDLTYNEPHKTEQIESDSSEHAEPENLDSEQEESTSSDNMRHDILGLDRQKIMSKIILGMNRAKKRDDNTTNENSQLANSPNIESVSKTKEEILDEVKSDVLRKAQFLEFLKQRRIMKSKEEKRESTLRKEKEFLDEERLIRSKEMNDMLSKDFFLDDKEDDDYFEEDEKR